MYCDFQLFQNEQARIGSGYMWSQFYNKLIVALGRDCIDSGEKSMAYNTPVKLEASIH